MHWTATLTYRFFPPDAKVVGDLPCVGCGYNLRGLTAGGSCPECGAAVEQSLTTLRRPEAVAAALRSMAWSYSALFSFVIGVPALLLSSAGGMWLVLGLLTCGIAFRLVGVAQLRFRADVESLPVLGPRLQRLWWITIIELVLGLGGVFFFYWTVARAGAILGGTAPGPVEAMAGWWMLAWLLCTGASCVVVGLFGGALAVVLGYPSIERELAIQRLLLILGPVLGLLFVGLGFVTTSVGNAAAQGQMIGLAGGALLGFCWLVAVGYTVVGLLHLASGAERAVELREDVMDASASATPLSKARPAAPDLPDINLEE